MLHKPVNGPADLPLIYSAPMIVVTLGDLKTMTRRGAYSEKGTPTPWLDARPGDRVWVKETWRTAPEFDDLRPLDVPAGAPIWFEADQPTLPIPKMGKLRSGRFMPKVLSRITQVIKAVTRERLQDITVEDALAEGVTGTDFYAIAEHKVAGGAPWAPERLAFADLWNALHGAGAWEANPEVVAMTVDTYMVNINEMGK